MSVLITFDLDGTLLTGNYLHHDAFAFAFKKVFSIDARIAEVPHNGMTDSAIIYAVLSRHGLSREEIEPKMPLLFQEMSTYYDIHLKSDDPEPHLLPGVVNFLDLLSKRVSFPFALVTGNISSIGWKKISKLGIQNFFGYGGFGDEHEDRTKLIEIAIRKAEEQTTFRVSRIPTNNDEIISNVFHFGDTPSDVLAAKNAGVRAIAVCTGKFTKHDLEQYNPFGLVENLTDVPHILNMMNLGDV
eukprot:TRINITY_DN12400_c0_g1_i1.p1 TRINITY_DN12400_c0_g1~~TRINITY_DN12400_c0_g1_i1.p1  ORF type:complete len:243 (+),score=28.31 TRINITY_DN12400_c0_g1_i1:237-965(+)